MTNCRECGAAISTRAAACPQCGARAKKKTSVLTWIAAAVAAGVVGSCVAGLQPGHEQRDARQAATAASEAAKTPEQRASEAAAKAKTEAEFQFVVSAARAAKAAMKDPASFELVTAGLTDAGTACLIYRGKNSFNAVTTEQLAVAKTGKTVPWNGNCGTQRATDYSHARQAL